MIAAYIVALLIFTSGFAKPSALFARGERAFVALFLIFAGLWAVGTVSSNWRSQSFNVLGHSCQEELLPNELQSAQAQAPQPDLILKFGE